MFQKENNMEIKVGNFTFNKGLYKILGYNGTGKTTLLTAIFLGKDFLNREVLFDGKTIKEIGKKGFEKIQSKKNYLKSSGNYVHKISVEKNK